MYTHTHTPGCGFLPFCSCKCHSLFLERERAHAPKGLEGRGGDRGGAEGEGEYPKQTPH